MDGDRPVGAQYPRSDAVHIAPYPYAFLLDVAGQEESSMSTDLRKDGTFEFDSFRSRDAVTLRIKPSEPQASLGNIDDTSRRCKSIETPASSQSRDSVTLRIIEIDLSTLGILQAPTYRAVYLQQWTGQNHIAVFGKIKSLAESWNPQHIVIDATGVGEGLWAMLDKAFPTRVIPVKFTQAVKSELGYGFLAIINTGRFRDCVPCAETDRQYAACESEVLTGPSKIMRWGVPEGRRDENGLLIHDDIPVTDFLTSILDDLTWIIHTDTVIIQPPDPLLEMDTNY